MTMKMLLLSLAGQRFSSSIEQVRHILAGPEIFPLVCLRRGISGVFLYKNEPIPILDPGELPELDGQKVKVGEEYLIVFQSEYGDVGLPVDAAVSIVDAEDGSFENVVRTEETSQDDQLFCFQDVSYPLLDIDKILVHLTV